MEKLKKLLLGYWCPIVIGLMTILFIGFSFLPLLDFELTNENSFSLSLIQIILGGEYGEVTFKFDALFCFIYLVFILGVIFYFCGYFINFKNHLISKSETNEEINQIKQTALKVNSITFITKLRI